MPRIRFIHSDGTEEAVEGNGCDSVMRAAVNNGVDGIVAECGGSAMCATCHVYVAESFLNKLSVMLEVEDELLDGTAAERKPNSRLSCQLKMSEVPDGLIVQLPDRQL